MIWIILLAVASACPYAFQALWMRRWFRVCWWIAILIIVSNIARIYLLPALRSA